MDEIDKIESSKPMIVEKKKNGMATASLILGIIGIITGLFFIGSLFGLLAIIFGIIALVKASKTPEIGGKGKAIAGIIMGAIVIIIILITMVIGLDDFIRGYRDGLNSGIPTFNDTTIKL